MKAHAEELAPGRIRFHHELTGARGGGRRGHRHRDRPGGQALLRDRGSLRPRLRRWPHGREAGRDRARRPPRAESHRHGAPGRGLLRVGQGSRRPAALGVVPRKRQARRARSDGSDTLGRRERGVGRARDLRHRRPAGIRRRRRPRGRARGARDRRPPARRQAHHPLDDQRRSRRPLPVGPRLRRGRCRAPPPADRRPRPDQRHPRRPEPVLEAGPRAPGCGRR